MATVALQQVSSAFARRNATKTLEKPIGLTHVRRFLESSLYATLEATCRDGAVYVWGAKAERLHQTYKMLGRSSLVLFRRGRQIYKYGVVIEKTDNEALAEYLWGRDDSGATWSTIYFFAKIKEKIIPAAKINEQLGRSANDNWQGLVVLEMKESATVDEFFRRELGGF